MASLTSEFRDNAPLFGVGLVLVLAFLALALLGGGAEGRSDRNAKLDAEQIAELPAGADADNTIVSTLDPTDARARNAAVPLAAGGPGAAPAFRFGGSVLDRERARKCLALAAMAEAGAGDADQRAVMQVILNRARHPAFASTVCGVVFQGSERPTGCQFTFTCDGSLGRGYSQSLWNAAYRRADEALGGYVHAPVGNATHYHADYVYPWWSPKLDKIAVVGPHVFLRWRGDFGSTGVWRRRYTGGEPDPFALSERAQEVERPQELLEGIPLVTERGAPLRTITPTGRRRPGGEADRGAPEPEEAPAEEPLPSVHFEVVSPADPPQALVDRARRLCPGKAYCQVYGWDNPAAVPERLPLSSAARGALRFSFLAARNSNSEAIYFDCRMFASPGVGSCLPRARN